MMRKFGISILAGLGFAACVTQVMAHPHVFVDANIDVVRNQKGEFTELRQVWRFDELFSETMILDFDEDGSNDLNAEELKTLSAHVQKSIADYDFFTALRIQGKSVEFYEPDELQTYIEDRQMIMLLAVKPEKPYDFSDGPLKVSASDTSFYVAFDYEAENVKVEGNFDGCTTSVEHPNFDELYADNSLSLTEAFFDDPTKTDALGDEFHSWATIDCK
jgi:ABC-type uncharacterized transport system substrate-binding protein